MKDLRKLFSHQKHDAFAESGHPHKTEAAPLLIKTTHNFWTDLGCAAWKLRQKMFDHKTGEPKEEMRHLVRNVETIWDRLSEIGLEIQDHTGQPFDSGQSLEVLAFQPTPGVQRETVAETVRPTIYFMGRRILMGQVIVATPEGTASGEKRP
jgi:hypothetical protein